MKKYIYCHRKLNFIENFFDKDVDALLNEMGAEGWECYWIERTQPLTISLLFISTNKLAKEHTFYFKKEID